MDLYGLTEMRQLMEIVEAGKVSDRYPESFVSLVCMYDEKEAQDILDKLDRWGFICNDPHFERVDPDGPKRWIWTHQYKKHLI